MTVVELVIPQSHLTTICRRHMKVLGYGLVEFFKMSKESSLSFESFGIRTFRLRMGQHLDGTAREQ